VTTLIVATDGSDLAIQAALAGISLTKRADKLLLVSAVDLVDPVDDATGHAGPTMTQEEVTASHREAKAEGQAAVAATAEALRDVGYEPEQVETLLIEGDAGPALCRLAADVDASALIVGSRGRGRLKRALLGSVSDYIVRNAPCSVVVSRNRES
jgi:nucleotide-binding universal stress UspA family protein